METLKVLRLATLWVLVCLSGNARTYAQGGGDPDIFGPQMSYDADSIGLSKDASKSIFEGNVVAIGGGAIITADKLELDKNTGNMTATGHVVVLTPTHVFTGEALEYHWETGDFMISHSHMVANDKDRVKRVSDRLLGFTPREIEFEAKRSRHLDYLATKKGELRDQFRLQAKPDEQPSEGLIDRYALTLEQEDLARSQENQELRKLSVDRRKRLQKRREYWEASRSNFVGAGRGNREYFKISGNKIEKTNGNDFKAYEATWTPCVCEDDEDPAWGFHADRIEAQNGGYVDLYHPVLQINGYPILYMPYLKMPMKSTRQSGFLMPTFRTGDSRNGNIYSQPVFFDIQPNLDATLTTDVIERRGTRVGTEIRYAQKRYSGFRLNVETIRDGQWMDDRSRRALLIPVAASSIDGESITQAEKDAKKERMLRQLQIPANTWRHASEWEGLAYLAPRLSVVTSGQMRSDHRYVEDLTLDEALDVSLTSEQPANQFNQARIKTHLDGKDFYLGLASHMGDSVLSRERMSGYQMPNNVTVQSRMINLDSGRVLPVPAYGSVRVEHKSILKLAEEPEEDERDLRLGQGRWQRIKLDLVSPLVKEGVVTIDHFSDMEYRHIRHNLLEEKTSHIHSWRTGFRFKLPVDGLGRMPDFMQPDDWRRESKGARYLHHLSNWVMTLSARPVTARRGPYGEIRDDNNAQMVYFGSDRKIYERDDDAASVEESMMVHQRVRFDTNHEWRVYRRGWKLIPGMPDKPGTELSYREKARRELLMSLDRPVAKPEQIFTSETDQEGEETGRTDWHVNRYERVKTEQSTPVSFNADMTYDFILAEQRRLQRREKRPDSEQAEPWNGPNANLTFRWSGYSLSNAVEYNVYKRTSTKSSFTLGLPVFLLTSMSYNVTLQKQTIYDETTQERSFKVTKERSLAISSDLIPRLNTGVVLRKRNEEEVPEKYETQVKLTYLSSSDCWGLQFRRVKQYDADEKDAHYELRLTILFLGQQRGYNVGKSLEREVARDDS